MIKDGDLAATESTAIIDYIVSLVSEDDNSDPYVCVYFWYTLIVKNTQSFCYNSVKS